MLGFDESQETGDWLHQEAHAELEQGTLTSVQHAATENEEAPPGDEQEDVETK